MKWEEWNCPGPDWNKTWPPLHEPKRNGHAPRPKLSQAQIEKRTRYVNEHYEVIEWVEPGKARVTCKNFDAHTNPTRDEDTIIFIGADELGAVSYHCSHAHCEEFNKDETQRLWVGFLVNETLPIPNDTARFSKMLAKLFNQLAENSNSYRRSEEYPYEIFHWPKGASQVVTMTKGTLKDILGMENIRFSKTYKNGDQAVCLPPKEIFSDILEARYAEQLPVAELIVKNALLVKTEAGCELIGESYCPELKTIVLGKTSELPEVSYSEGYAFINELLDYWLWTEPIDRVRAWAQLLTPALLAGGFIERPIPAFLIMADEFKAGKTAWQENVAVIYGQTLVAHVYTKNNISNIEEHFQGALLRGDPFFFVDELDGTIKSTLINATITGGDEADVRIAYHPQTRVSTRKTMILLAGVKSFIIDEQLASRTIIMRIVRPASDGHYRTADDEHLKTYIQQNAGRYLASIYAVIKEWVARGSIPIKADESRFPFWERAVNGILAMLGLPRATEGLEELQNEVSNPAANWIPEFTKLLEEAGVLYSGEDGQEPACLSLPQLRNICDQEGLEIPGINPALRDVKLQHIKARQIGKIIASLPRAHSANGAEPIYRLGPEFYLVQYQLHDGHKPRKFYLFTASSNRLPRASDVTKHQFPADDVV